MQRDRKQVCKFYNRFCIYKTRKLGAKDANIIHVDISVTCRRGITSEEIKMIWENK